MSEYKNNGEKVNNEQSKIDNLSIERTDTLRLTREFNEKFFKTTRKTCCITNFSIMKDDIKNYRPLTDMQISQIDTLTENEKTEIIKIFNIMFSSYIENVIV